MGQGLAPAMQDRDHADLGAEMFGIGADGADRLGRGLEEDIVDDRLVLQGDRCERGRYGEDEMKIRDWQKFGAAVGQPLPLALRLPPRLLPASPRPLAALPPPFPPTPARCVRERQVELLRQSRRTRRTGRLRPPPCPPAPHRLGRLRQTPVRGAEQVLDYLGRYTHRVAIANSRLLACEDGRVRVRSGCGPPGLKSERMGEFSGLPIVADLCSSHPLAGAGSP